MAETILFPVVVEVLKKLGSLASQQLGMLCGLNDDLTKLKSTVSAIQAVLLDAEKRQYESNNTIADWLQKLEEAFYYADDVLDELSSEALRREVMTRDKNAKQVRIFFSRYNQIASNYRMARQIKNIWKRLDVLAAEKNNFHLRENNEQTQIMTRMETWSSPNEEEVIGREDDKKKVKDFLLDMNVAHNVSFIAIVGMGGIGKTTLAKSLYNNKEVSECFDLKIWIWVSDQFEVKVVVKKIIESATRINHYVDGMEALQRKLQEVIGGKKYMLVMDDVWNESEVKWHELKPLLMGGARGSKILITKRNSIVAQAIKNMTSLFTLKGLPESNSWFLFRKVAFTEGKEPKNPNLRQLGEEILLKCGGVPLVIRHIGRLLYSKTSEEEWMSFKDNDLLKVIQEKNDMTSTLKLSYNHLSPNLKQCFAYLSLFPKGEYLTIKELVRQWVAHGFIESSDGSKSMEDIGNEYFKELCWRFFCENSSDKCNFDDYVYMHDVMRELAANVAGEKYVRGNLNDNYVVSEKTRHISIDHEIKSWRDLVSKLRKAKGLRTFQVFLYYRFKKKNEITDLDLDELFTNFPRLRVLHLKDLGIYTVPNSIKKLRHLRYLDLSYNDIESLPNSITQLQNLQTLNIMYCDELKDLPRDTSNLVNLRHLDFYPKLVGGIMHMPEGMGKLSCLQTLEVFMFDCRRSNKLSELNEVKSFTRELKITGLEVLRSRSPSEVSLINLKDKKGLRFMRLEWSESMSGDKSKYESEGDEIVMESLQPHPNVEFLHIYGYNGVGLPNWFSTSLSNLTQMIIIGCDRLQHLPQLGHLQFLKDLILRNMRCLKFISKNEPCFSCSFPSLDCLIFEDMPNLEGWWELGESRPVRETLPMFPQLTVLSIEHCPKLSSMPKLASIGAKVLLCDVGVEMVSTIGPLSRLQGLTLREIKDMKYLEIMESQTNQHDLLGFIQAHMSSPNELRDLSIVKCSNLMSLPESIGNFTLLEELKIKECPKLKSLPDGMRRLKSLRKLHIEGCPELEQRCKQGGEDWPKIAHVHKRD